MSDDDEPRMNDWSISFVAAKIALKDTEAALTRNDLKNASRHLTALLQAIVEMQYWIEKGRR